MLLALAPVPRAVELAVGGLVDVLCEGVLTRLRRPVMLDTAVALVHT